MILNRINYYIPFIIIVLFIAGNTWLFGFQPFHGTEDYFIIGLTFVLLLFTLSFDEIFSFKLNIISRHPYFLLLFFSFFISIIFFNFQELEDFAYVRRILAFFCYIYLYFFMLPKFFQGNNNYLFKFLKFFSVLSTVFGFFGIIFLYFGINPIGKFDGMLISFSIHPNNISTLFMYSIFITVFLYLYSRKSNENFSSLWFWFSIFIQLYALLLTLSRAAVLGVAVGLLIFSFYIFKKKYLYFIYPSLLIMLPPYLMSYSGAKGSGSILSRILLLVPAYYMITASSVKMLFGYGVSNNILEYEKAKDFYNVFSEEGINTPHNMIVSLILMVGLIFTAIFLIMVAVLVVRCLKKSINSNGHTKLYIGFLISTIGAIMVQEMFESLIILTQFYVIQVYLLFLGLMYRYLYYDFVPFFKKDYAKI